MSIYRVGKGDVEATTIVTNPVKSYTSSSVSGVTGSVYVYARRTELEKDIDVVSSFDDSIKNDNDINTALKTVQEAGNVIRNSTSDQLKTRFSSAIQSYLDAVNAQGLSTKKRKTLDISRFIPSYTFTTDTLKKLIVKDILNKHYRTSYPTAHWAYTNYNCLNFFTASTVCSDAVLLYPNIPGPNPVEHIGYVTGAYALSGAWSFDFYINPRYSQDSNDGDYKAGTIFHLSSSYAVSLVSGSLKDANGRSTGFRLKLQVSHSADVPPSLATQGNYPNDLIFLSDDNSLLKNHWHHVVIRWGTNLINKGTGSFNIDGVDKGQFVIPSGTIMPKLRAAGNSEVLCVGNYYEGKNTGGDALSLFFATNPSERDGLARLVDDGGVADQPANFYFRHKLNAEVHDLAIKRYYMSSYDIVKSASVGPLSLDKSVGFYVPPFFTQQSPIRKYVGSYGGILQTPFFEIDGTTDDPFNVAMSFGVAGHYINIENFVRDLATNNDPRCFNMTGTAGANSTTAKPANDFIYEDKANVARNMLIMPCDDGNFIPAFELLVSESFNRLYSGSTTQLKYVDDTGATDYSLISLDNLISTSSFVFGPSIHGTSSFVTEMIGPSPESPALSQGSAFSAYIDKVNDAIASGTYEPGVQKGVPLTIYQRTRDESSNQVTFFNISNLFYGNRIKPGSFVITDTSFSSSGGAISLTLKDDGMGNLYRSDSYTSSSTWNSVGNIYYDEGVIVIKSPHLFFFGKEQYDIEFRGEQNIHVLKVNAVTPVNQLNSSSNPTYKNISLPNSVFDSNDDKFVYISNINFHDENLNVIMKASLAQPIMKREGDTYVFRVRMDV